MVNLKRKHSIPKDPSSLSTTSSNDPKTNKRSRPASNSNLKPSHSNSDPQNVINHSSSHIQPTEVDFPRGGGTHLTAVEVTQARHEGKKDADQLFTSTSQPPASDSIIPQSASSKRKRPLKDSHPKPNHKSRSGLSDSRANHISDTIRIEHLNHRRLIPGIKLAGLIIAIRPLELIVSLPSQLVGHVPITEISSYYTQELQNSTENVDDDDDQSVAPDSENDEDQKVMDRSDNLKGLNEIFKVGQWVRCIVIEKTSAPPSKARRVSTLVRAALRVTLSLDPVRLNGNLTKDDLCPDMTLDGTVKSIEDNGYVLDLGVPLTRKPQASSSASATPTVTTFVSFAEAAKLSPDRHKTHEASAQWQVGQIVQSRIHTVPKTGSTCTVFLDPGGIAASLLKAASSIDCILPLHLVKCLITAVIPGQGLNVKFLAYYKGTIDAVSLGCTGDGKTLEERFKTGQEIRARVLWHTVSSHSGFPDDDAVQLGEKTFCLTSLEHCVKMVPSGLPLNLKTEYDHLLSENIEPILKYPIGYVFQSVRVCRVWEEWGVYVICSNGESGEPISGSAGAGVSDPPVIGFIHISALSNSHVDSIPYRVGTTHKARVIGISPIDGMLQLSSQPSVIDQPYLRPQDVPVGEIVTAEIGKLTPGALFLSISGGLDCVVWPDHYSDVKHKHPEKKFKVGSKVAARVLYVNPDKHRIVLTLRKTLLQPDLPLITSYATAQVGMVTDAFISRVTEKALHVDFFGQTKGVVPIVEVSESFTDTLIGRFTSGQLIRVKIFYVDVPGRKITASIKRVSSESNSDMIDSCSVGDPVMATVKKVHGDNILLSLRQVVSKKKVGRKIPIPGLISLHILARKRHMTSDQLKAQLETGDEVGDLVITAKDLEKRLIILGFKALHGQSFTSHSATVDEKLVLQLKDAVVGTIERIDDSVIVLRLQKRGEEGADKVSATGLLSISVYEKHRVSVENDMYQPITVGQSIADLVVTKLVPERGLTIVGFARADKVEKKPEVRAPLNSSAFDIGDMVLGTVLDVHEKNVLVFLKKEGSEDSCVGQGLLGIEKLARRRRITIEELRNTLVKGDRIDDLTVKFKAVDQQPNILGFRSAPGNRVSTSTPVVPPDLAVNMSVVGIVRAIHDQNVVLSLRTTSADNSDCGDSLGLISKKLLAGHWNTTVDGLKSKLSEGVEIPKLVIRKMNTDKGIIILGFEQPLQPLRYFSNADPSETLVSPLQLAEGTLIDVSILEKTPEGIHVQPTATGFPGWSFLIDYPDLHDDYDQSLGVKKGDPKQCTIVKVDRQTRKVYLTTRPSVCNREKNGSPKDNVKDRRVVSIKDLKKGDCLRGFVRRIATKSGLIVSIGTNVQAKVRISELFDEDVTDWTTKFKVGQVISGVIVTPVKCTQGIQISLRKNPGAPKGKINLENLTKGQILSMVVKKIERYGMFLSIPSSRISGLCHTSQMFDEDDVDAKHKDWAKHFSEGMKLNAAVVDVDPEKRRISLTIKPSIVGTQERKENSDDMSDGENSEGENSDDAEDELPTGSGDEPLLSSSSDEHTDDEEDLVITGSTSVHKLSSGRESIPVPLAVDIEAPCLSLPAGFNWSAQPQMAGADCSSDSDDSSEEHLSVSGEATNQKLKKSSESKSQAKSTLHADLPSSAELQRLLLGSPNSSLLWIQLMSHHLQRADVNEARETARRALNGIHYREEAEKLNVWIAWLNLENSYGSEEEMAKVFTEASAANDKKTLWLKTAEIYTESGKVEKADELHAKLVKKMSDSSKVWTHYARFCLLNGRVAQAADLLARSLKSLPKRKHVKTIAKFAQLEFNHGDSERGRTLFEGLLASYPKRTDLWNIYIDLEVKDGPRLDRVRAIFARMLTLKLNPKRSKFVFKKWLGLEKQYGDEASQSRVLEQARAYVQASAGQTANPEQDDE